MCIKIIKDDLEIKYNPEIPIEQQLKGSEEIYIKYDSSDKTIGRFLSEMEKICAMGLNLDVKINFTNNDSIQGAKTKRKIKKIKKDLNLNEAIKILAILQSKTDETLKELSNFCRK